MPSSIPDPANKKMGEFEWSIDGRPAGGGGVVGDDGQVPIILRYGEECLATLKPASMGELLNEAAREFEIEPSECQLAIRIRAEYLRITNSLYQRIGALSTIHLVDSAKTKLTTTQQQPPPPPPQQQEHQELQLRQHQPHQQQQLNQQQQSMGSSPATIVSLLHSPITQLPDLPQPIQPLSPPNLNTTTTTHPRKKFLIHSLASSSTTTTAGENPDDDQLRRKFPFLANRYSNNNLNNNQPADQRNRISTPFPEAEPNHTQEIFPRDPQPQSLDSSLSFLNQLLKN